VSFKSVHTGGVNAAFGDGSVRSVRNSIGDRVWRAMKLGKFGEKPELLPGVSLPEIDRKAPESQEPVGFGMMIGLTRVYFVDPAAQRTQLDLLAQAEAASRSGDIAGMRDILSKYLGNTRTFAEQAKPAAPYSAIAFVGGWGSSMYQYANSWE